MASDRPATSLMRLTRHQRSFELTETEVELRTRGKSDASVHRKTVHRLEAVKTHEEPVYLYENKRVDVQAWLKNIKPNLGRGKSLTHRRLPRTTIVQEPHTPTRLTRDFPKTPTFNEVETERYRHNLMYCTYRMKPSHQLVGAIKKEYLRDTAEERKVVRADILFSRLLVGMRALASPKLVQEPRELPPFMVIKKPVRTPKHDISNLSSWLRRHHRDHFDPSRHQSTVLASFFDALDVESTGKVQGLNLLHFLQHLGLDLNSVAFNSMLEAYLSTSVGEIVTKQQWMRLLTNDIMDENVGEGEDWRGFEERPVTPVESNLTSVMTEVEEEVSKANSYFQRFKRWWDRISQESRGHVSLKVASVAISDQYRIDFKDVFRLCERLYCKEALMTEQRFLVLLYPNLLSHTLTQIGVRLFKKWSADKAPSFEGFISTVARKRAMGEVIRPK